MDEFHASTPTSVPGGKVITTFELREMLVSGKNPLLINALSGDGVPAIPHSIQLKDAGRGGNFDDAYQTWLTDELAQAAHGDKNKVIVFYCVGAECVNAH